MPIPLEHAFAITRAIWEATSVVALVSALGSVLVFFGYAWLAQKTKLRMLSGFAAILALGLLFVAGALLHEPLVYAFLGIPTRVSEVVGQSLNIVWVEVGWLHKLLPVAVMVGTWLVCTRRRARISLPQTA